MDLGKEGESDSEEDDEEEGPVALPDPGTFFSACSRFSCATEVHASISHLLVFQLGLPFLRTPLNTC